MALSALKGSSASNWGFTFKKTNAALSDPELGITNSYSVPYTFGTGNSQANKVYSAVLSISASATTTLDLDAGTMLDPYGDALVFTQIKGFRIYHQSTTGGSASVTVQGDFITTIFGASTSYPLVDGAIWMHTDVDGLTVTSTTGDAITITETGGSQTATVIVDIIGN